MRFEKMLTGETFVAKVSAPLLFQISGG